MVKLKIISALILIALSPTGKGFQLMKSFSVESISVVKNYAQFKEPKHIKNINKHQKYGFFLDDHHSWIKCKVCHKKSSKKTGFNACVECHLVKHQGLSDNKDKKDCKSCHKKSKTKEANYNHGISWLNTIPHLSSNCFMCHKTNLKNTTKGCFSCHKKPSKHFSGSCSNCHKSSGWLAKFEHPSGFRNGAHGYLKCDSCHGQKGFKISASCTTCHNKPVNHPPGDCLKCHNMSSWKNADLTHRLGILTSAHANLSCNACHGSRGFKINASCITCHNKPINHPSGICTKCHNLSGWKNINFTHSSRIIEGAHAGLSCNNCHEIRGYSISSACTTCHSEPANHFPGDCFKCHNMSNWKANISHPAGVLSGAHARLSCRSCHGSRGYNISSACTACHRKPSRHFPGSCLKCHNRSTWREAKVSHLAGVLSGAHARLSCRSCHGSRGYNISSACTACHRKPSRHFPGSCLKCHNRSNWSASFNHPGIREHSYRSFPCAKCHPSGYSSHGCTCHGGGNGPSEDHEDRKNRKDHEDQEKD